MRWVNVLPNRVTTADLREARAAIADGPEANRLRGELLAEDMNVLSAKKEALTRLEQEKLLPLAQRLQVAHEKKIACLTASLKLEGKKIMALVQEQTSCSRGIMLRDLVCQETHIEASIQAAKERLDVYKKEMLHPVSRELNRPRVAAPDGTGMAPPLRGPVLSWKTRQFSDSPALPDRVHQKEQALKQEIKDLESTLCQHEIQKKVIQLKIQSYSRVERFGIKWTGRGRSSLAENLARIETDLKNAQSRQKKFDSCWQYSIHRNDFLKKEIERMSLNADTPCHMPAAETLDHLEREWDLFWLDRKNLLEEIVRLQQAVELQKQIIAQQEATVLAVSANPFFCEYWNDPLHLADQIENAIRSAFECHEAKMVHNESMFVRQCFAGLAVKLSDTPPVDHAGNVSSMTEESARERIFELAGWLYQIRDWFNDRYLSAGGHTETEREFLDQIEQIIFSDPASVFPEKQEAVVIWQKRHPADASPVPGETETAAAEKKQYELIRSAFGKRLEELCCPEKNTSPDRLLSEGERILAELHSAEQSAPSRFDYLFSVRLLKQAMRLVNHRGDENIIRDILVLSSFADGAPSQARRLTGILGVMAGLAGVGAGALIATPPGIACAAFGMVTVATSSFVFYSGSRRKVALAATNYADAGKSSEGPASEAKAVALQETVLPSALSAPGCGR